MSQTKRLLSNSIIVFVGTIVGSIFSYAFNMLMGRLLGPAQYGDMSAIMSLLAITSVAGGTILTVTMRYTGETYAGGHFASLKKIFNIFTRYVVIFGAALFIIGLFFARFITDFLSIHSLVAVMISFVAFLTGFTILITKGFLQGIQDFKSLSFVTALEMVLRLAFGLLFIKVGFELDGAISAIILATGLTYLLSLVPIRKFFLKHKQDNRTEEFKLDKKEVIAYSVPTFITMLLLAISMNIDVIVVKHYFPSDQAGIYAAISTIGKIILYITAPIIGVMFPMISEHRTKGEKHYKLFLYSLILTIVGAVSILIVYTVAPALVIRILYGQAYLGAQNLLPIVGIMIMIYSLINLVCNYYLAIKSFLFVWFYAFAIILQLVLILFYHSSILEVVKIFIFTLGLLFFLLMIGYLYLKKDRFIEVLKGEYEGNPQALDNNSGV